MKIDFARLNHILIPTTSSERDRLRATRSGKTLFFFFGFFSSLTDEGRTLAVLTPLIGALAVDVRRTTAYVVFALLAALLVASLVAGRTLVLHGTTVQVHAPRRVTIGDELTFTIRCRREGGDDAPASSIRVRGPFLPYDGRWTGIPLDEMVLGSEAVTATMKARFAARGLHHLDPFSAALVAPLGLAVGPRVGSSSVEVYVVPKIANVARLPTTIAARHQPGGVALASKHGESMELAGVRPYRPGDPVRDLHARTWARTGVPAVREYQQEYFTRVGVVLDSNASDPDLLEAAISLAAGVVARLSRGEALIDVLVVGDRVHELTVGRSLGRLDQALELLSTVVRGPRLDATRLVRRIEPHLAQLSSVVAIVVESNADELAAILKQRGISCTTIVVDAKLARAIASGEALAW